MSNNKKSIILCAPLDFGLFDSIKKGLEELDFEITGFPIEDSNYKYKNIFTRVHSALRKIIFNDRQFKTKLKLKERSISLNKQLLVVKPVDFALFIRPDMYPVDFIKNVQKISDKTSAYHWDSMERFPNVVNFLDLFDRFFVFDQNDSLRYPKTKVVTNFYIPDKFPLEISKERTAFLIGSYDENRLNESIQLKSILTQFSYTCDFTLKSSKIKQIAKLRKNGINAIKNSISYSRNLEKVKSSSLVIDLHNPRQTGLSFRAFEALNYNKKLITTNPHITKYDFFHPNNIFLWDGKNGDEIAFFLAQNIVDIPQSVKAKYSLKNWIQYIMEEEPYKEIKVH